MAFSGYLEVVDDSSGYGYGGSQSWSSAPSISNATLDLDAVKRMATQEDYSLISFSQTSRVISFRKEGETDNDSVRINVYWTTGTVGTCIHHPRQGKTQLFRRNVDLATLREIFRNPRVHTGSGYHRRDQCPQYIIAPNCPRKLRVGDRVYVRGYADGTVASLVYSSGTYRGKVLVRYDDGQSYHVDPDQLREPSQVTDDEQCQGLENEVKMQMKKLDEEMQRIQREKEALGQILRSFEEEREKERVRKEKEEAARRQALKRKAEEEAAAILAKQRKLEKDRLESRRDARGRQCDFSLYDSDHVKKCFDEEVTTVACGGRATILLYESGGWAFTSGMPTQLHNKLNGRQNSLPPPVYVSMGSQNRYYVEFKDGKSEWVGCDEMGEKLKQTSRTVKSVAFGEYWDSYFIVYTDGYWEYNNIPSGLSDILDRRQKKSDLTCVSLGPDGEYYISAKNGRAWWGGMSDEQLTSVRKHRDSIKFMDFGDNESYFYRY